MMCPACLRAAGGARAERWKFLRSPSSAARDPDPPMTSSPIPADRSQYLLDLLAQVPDPRKRRGRRHPLAGLLDFGVAAVIAGSRSFAAIGQWAADAGPEVLAVLGAARGPAEESTFRRAFALVSADVLDRVLGAWLWTRAVQAGGRLGDRGRRQDRPGREGQGREGPAPVSPICPRPRCHRSLVAPRKHGYGSRDNLARLALPRQNADSQPRALLTLSLLARQHRQHPHRAGSRRPVVDDGSVRGNRSLRDGHGAGAPAGHAARAADAGGGRRRQRAGRREPGHLGGSLTHGLWAAVTFTALIAWPTGPWRRGPSVPWGPRPAVSAATATLLAVLAWYLTELTAKGGLRSLAERVIGVAEVGWPLAVVLSWRRPAQRSTAAPCATSRRA
jgi:hypothetical protein